MSPRAASRPVLAVAVGLIGFLTAAAPAIIWLLAFLLMILAVTLDTQVMACVGGIGGFISWHGPRAFATTADPRASTGHARDAVLVVLNASRTAVVQLGAAGLAAEAKR